MTGTIVVGVDGSEASNAAVCWARDEAALRHGTLQLVHVWTYPYVGDAAAMAAYVQEADLTANAQAVLDAAAALALDTTERLSVTTKLVHGAPARALLDAAADADADLLVVGSRGRGGFSGLLLGSVSQQCAHHATMPIVIVPREART